MRGISALILLTAYALGAYAAADDVTIHVEAGVGDTIRAGSPSPVRVRLSNHSGIDYDGRVGVAFEGVMGQPPTTWTWSNVQMASGAEKVVHLVIPPGESPQRILAQYIDQRGRQVANGNGRIIALENTLPCVLSIGTAPRSLPDVVDGEKQRYTSLVAAQDFIPRSQLGLSMFDAIIVSPTPYEPFTEAQISVLRDWVLRGGILVVDISQRSDFIRSEGFGDILPYTPLTSLQGDLGVFPEPLRYTTGAQEGGKVAWAAGDTPLLISEPCGLGTVYCFAVDPDSPAFLKSEVACAQWQEILQPLHLYDTSEVPQVLPDAAPVLRNALASSMESGPKSSVRLGAVILLTLLYALAVGPGDYLLIRWLRRPRLTWLTFPAIVIAFTAFSYFGAKTYIGGDLSATSRVRIMALLDEDRAVQNTVDAVFVPAADTYTVATTNNAPLFPLTASGLGGEPRLDLYPDEGRAEHDIPIWTQRFYSSDTTIACPDIEFALSIENGDVIANINNNSPYSLIDHGFALGRFHLQRAGTEVIPPGGTSQFRIGTLEEVGMENISVLSRGDYVEIDHLVGDYFTQRMALYRTDFPASLGSMRDYNLRLALDQGAAVWLCRAKLDAAEAPIAVDGKPGTPPAVIELQLVTYEGANL